VKLTRYHPPIRQLQEEFAARIARRRYTRGKGPRPPKLALGDNSEPWIAHPDSVADDWAIACKVADRVEIWKRQLTSSSGS
jgi:hypothetical protein